MAETARGSRIGDEVRTAREAAGMSRERLAQMAGVSVSTVVRMERDDALPAAVTFARIASALGLSLDRLFDVSTDAVAS